MKLNYNIKNKISIILINKYILLRSFILLLLKFIKVLTIIAIIRLQKLYINKPIGLKKQKYLSYYNIILIVKFIKLTSIKNYLLILFLIKYLNIYK